MAARWEGETPGGKELPEHVKEGKTRKGKVRSERKKKSS